MVVPVSGHWAGPGSLTGSVLKSLLWQDGKSDGSLATDVLVYKTQFILREVPPWSTLEHFHHLKEKPSYSRAPLQS